MTRLSLRAKELLALNIKTQRKKYGFSQEKLAENARLSTQTISDIEGCRTWVSDKTLEKLAKILNVDVFQFFMPPEVDNNYISEPLLYHRIEKLRVEMKNDIDTRLDRFFLSEKNVLDDNDDDLD